MENSSVTKFREYLRITSVQPNVDYTKCVEFIKRLGEEVGLETRVFGTVLKPVVILTWTGTDHQAGSILLNSHMDVVPVYKESWIHDPFAAVKDEQGNIYGRGAQDCKCLGIQYIEAVRKLKEEGFRPKRTVNISFVPDEEIGGVKGMGTFVNSDDFKKLKVAFALDEGATFNEDKFMIFNNERVAFPIKIVCNGTTGHGSLLHPNTAGEKLWKVLDAMMDFRQTQVEKLSTLSHPIFGLAKVTTVNLAILEGGVQNNVVPPELSMTFDVRLSVHTKSQEFLKWIQDICWNAGENITMEVLNDNPTVPGTATDSSNPFWIAMSSVLDEMKLKYQVTGCPGSTDARFLRKIGIPALGFSPIRNTEILVHSHNEMLNEVNFLEGIDVYRNLIKALVNV
uniref:N-acyl-aliphatic-L-amino acid amidohydrolase n=2 Tax=Triatoma infestans TaxID=30076 RepID=A0A023F7B3_TRIIF